MSLRVDRNNAAGNSITGAWIQTVKIFDYGRVEIRAVLPHFPDNGIWSNVFIHGFEDVLGSNGLKAIVNEGKVAGKYGQYNKFDYSIFHLYAMEWSKNEIKYFVDNHYIKSIRLNGRKAGIA